MTLQIPKRKVAAWVELWNGPEIKGTIFVDTITATHTGSQTVSEYLEQQAAFIPFEGPEGFQFLAKGSVALVRVREEDEMDDRTWDDLPLVPEDEDAAMPEVRVRVDLVGGRVVEGEMVSALPPENRRLIDYLNQERRFLVLRQGEDLCMVNKAHVATARPWKETTGT